MQLWFERKEVSTSGSAEFDALRLHLDQSPAVRREVEFAFSALVAAANPSDRGLRFLFGNGAEWIMAAAAWSAGVLTAPVGHMTNGFDLIDLLQKSRSLWSVKASASRKSSQIRLINFMGSGSNAVWREPTIFVSPYLGGAVMVDPSSASGVKGRARREGDALILPGGALKEFASKNPQNRILFEVAVSGGAASGDPHKFIKSVLDPGHFPYLAQPFLAASPAPNSSRVNEIERLAELRDAGALTDEQFKVAVDRVINS